MSTERKDPAIAALLSFLWMGVGNLYNGNVGKGIVFVVVGIIAVIFAFSLILLPVSLGLWIWAIVDAHHEAKAMNAANVQREQESLAEAGAAEAKRLAETTNSQRFRQAITKAYKIFGSGIINEAEYKQRIQALIADLASKELEAGEEVDDFLFEIAKLKELGALGDEEIRKIKTIVI